MTRILNEARDAYTAYLCVLCGSIFTSGEYHWGACGETGTRANQSCNNWSCPVCGGVVVEYARGPAEEPSGALAAPR